MESGSPADGSSGKDGAERVMADGRLLQGGICVELTALTMLQDGQTDGIRFMDIYKRISDESLMSIPARMKQAKRWVCWGGDKTPVSVCKGQSGRHYGIDVTNAENWGSCDDAVGALGDECYLKRTDEYFHVVGIGFVVGDGWFCADYDGGAKHRKEPVPESVIQDAVSSSCSYAEISLSGCGYHLFGECDFSVGNDEPESNRPHRDGNGTPLPDSYEVEFFTRRKFIVITGNVVPGSGSEAISCSAAARDLYNRYVYDDWKRDEEKRRAERERVTRSVPIDADEATSFFLLNYPEILVCSDSSNFKRGGKGHPLGPGEYSWIGAVKSMQEIGVPEDAIIEWCRRGSNFRSEKDVLKLLNERSKPGKSCIGSIIQDAKNHGWKPDPEKLTGEYLRNHERAEQAREMWSEYDSLREERIKGICEELGVEYRPGLGYTLNWDGKFDLIGPTSAESIETMLDKETGEVIWQRDGGGDPGQGGTAEKQISEITVHTTPRAASNPCASNEQVIEWQPIEKNIKKPDFPLELLPAWIAEHIRRYSATNGTPIDFGVAASFGAVSALTVGRIVIPFNGTHKEPIQLYSLFVGAPGTMKSSVIKYYLAPVKGFLNTSQAEVKKFNDGISRDMQMIEKQLTNEGKKKDPDNKLIQELENTMNEKNESRKKSYPINLTDVTPEAVQNYLLKTGGCGNIYSAEGNVVNVLLGRTYNNKPGSAPNIDVFLMGHDGEETHSIRITRPDVYIPHTNLSILLGVQPVLIQSFFNSVEARGRGLIQRFLIFSPDCQEKAIDHTKPVPIPLDSRVQWEIFISNIAHIYMNPDNPMVEMKLSDSADILIRDFWNYEEELKAMYRGEDDGIIGWISKLHGKALRVAAILALMNNEEADTISETDVKNSIAMFKQYFIPMYQLSYNPGGNISPAEEQIINWLVRHCKGGNQIRELTVYKDLRNRKSFSGPEGKRAFEETCKALIAKNYIRRQVQPTDARGPKPIIWILNPDMFADE